MTSQDLGAEKSNKKPKRRIRLSKTARTKQQNGFRQFWGLGNQDVHTENFDVSSDDTLLVREGNYQYDLGKIIQKFGTPTEIFFPTVIEERVRDLIETFTAYIKILGYKGKYHYHYPMKVNQNKEFVLAAVAEGANLDVASANELYLVKQMIEKNNFNNKIRVMCNGPKTEKYISLIEELRGKGMTVIPIIEDYNELERMKKFSGPVGIRVDLSVKINAHWDKKYNRFGFTESELLDLGKIKNLQILHYHISSQIESVGSITSPIVQALKLFKKMKENNLSLDTLDIGGGAAVAYNKYKKHYSLKKVVEEIVKTFKKVADDLQLKHPNIVSEWGRFVAAPAQITVYKVLAEKNVSNKNNHKWYVVDGSFMNDLVDTWAIHQKWHVVPVNNMRSQKLERAWLAGSSCDSDDKYNNGGEGVVLPKFSLDEELYIALLDTGAYQDSLASHHCLLSSPAKVLVQNGETKIIRKRETPEDVGKQFGW
jgi:arginine decarboxylase